MVPLIEIRRGEKLGHDILVALFAQPPKKDKPSNFVVFSVALVSNFDGSSPLGNVHGLDVVFIPLEGRFS